MAGKETPRQKMINMMYLIFIAMLALNMSKEVLTAFGSMNNGLVETNEELQKRNELFMQNLREKTEPGSPERDEWIDIKLKADSIRNMSTSFYSFLEEVKEGAYVYAENNGLDRDNYEKLDITTYFDEQFLDGMEYKDKGQEFINRMDAFRNEFVRIASSDPKLVDVAKDVNIQFSTENVIDKDGKSRKYLEYHYKGMPLIASITKLSLLQSDVQNIEADLLTTILEGKLRIRASLTNFTPIVIPDKNAFFAGENFTGRIVLGKNDPNLKADKVTINGNELDEDAMQEGQTLLNFNVGKFTCLIVIHIFR